MAGASLRSIGRPLGAHVASAWLHYLHSCHELCVGSVGPKPPQMFTGDLMNQGLCEPMLSAARKGSNVAGHVFTAPHGMVPPPWPRD